MPSNRLARPYEKRSTSFVLQTQPLNFEAAVSSDLSNLDI
jgi:hypothetical protein